MMGSRESDEIWSEGSVQHFITWVMVDALDFPMSKETSLYQLETETL